MRTTFKVLFYVKKGSEKPNGNLPLMCRLIVDVKNNRASGKGVEVQRINRKVILENAKRDIERMIIGDDNI